MFPVVPMRASRAASLAVIAALLVAVSVVRADEESHTYTDGEAVLVYANKMSPFNNPLETYAYFELPGCAPKSWEHKFPTLGQALAGDEIYQTALDVKFKHDIKAKLCDFKPSEADAQRWNGMVDEQYWYQLAIDGMPIWGTFGKKINGVNHIYTHQHLTIGYNGDKIVFANLTVSKEVPIKANEPVSFEYSAEFVPRTDIDFENRYRRYLDNNFFEHRIRWFSIFNAFMTVLFLAGMVLTILSRTLRSDYARFAKREEELDALGPNAEWSDESGWKQLHGDVFRVPQHAALLCALVGTGWQLVVLVLALVVFAIVAVVYTNPGALLTYGVFAFAVTSYFAGLVSASLFNDYSALQPGIANGWIRCMVLTASLFPGLVLTVGFLLNFVAIAYDSAQAIPFGGMVVMVLLWALISTPLVVMGTVVGRHRKPQGAAGRGELPRVHQVPRLIPQQPWYFQRTALAIAGGIMPFGSIFIELYFIFISFWSYTTYYVYGFVLLVFVMLLFVTACVTVVATYFMLNSEEHRWQWNSFIIGSSVSGYVFLYAAYFYFFKTRMTGFFMFAFYFTYMGLLCVGLGVLCGAVGFTASSMFVTRIFKNVKSD
jgi:transmembrane 9 superfamily protein 3